MNQPDDLGSPLNPIVMTIDDVIALYQGALERDDVERADFFLSLALTYNDPPKVDAP